jgi:hypothetical protein
VYFVLYSAYYGLTRLKLNSFSAFAIFLSYSTALALLCSAACGAIAFAAVRWFVRKLYSSIPFD